MDTTTTRHIPRHVGMNSKMVWNQWLSRFKIIGKFYFNTCSALKAPPLVLLTFYDFLKIYMYKDVVKIKITKNKHDSSYSDKLKFKISIHTSKSCLCYSHFYVQSILGPLRPKYEWVDFHIKWPDFLLKVKWYFQLHTSNESTHSKEC